MACKDNFKPWPRGIDTARFNPDKRSVAWRARHGIGADEIVVLHVSRLVREKRLDTLTAALSRITVPHRAVIVGEGPDRDFVAACPATRHFHRLPGRRGIGHGLCLVATFSSFPATAKASAMSPWRRWRPALPCVCADATGSRSLVVPGETGYLAPADDAEDFAGRITALVQDRRLAPAHGRGGPGPRPELFLGRDHGADAGLLSRGCRRARL